MRLTAQSTCSRCSAVAQARQVLGLRAPGLRPWGHLSVWAFAESWGEEAGKTDPGSGMCGDRRAGGHHTQGPGAQGRLTVIVSGTVSEQPSVLLAG